MRTRRPRALPAWLAVAVLLSVAIVFAPVQLGGSTIYSSTVGNSMEPRFHKGDLALARPAAGYLVGDVVLYESPVFHRPVLHRIIAIEDGRFFFKGDHNTFVDPGSVTRDELLGKLWLRVPRAGKALSWVGAPGHAAVIAALAMLLLLAGGGERARRRQPRRKPTGNVKPMRRNALHRPRKTVDNVAGGAALLLAAVLLSIGFTTPLRKTVPLSGAYRQTGTFAYSAQTLRATPAYPTGEVRSGDPVFLSLVDNLATSFSYRFRSSLPHRVHGTISLEARVSFQDTWHDARVVAPPRAFHGDRATAVGRLDLVKLRELLDRLAIEAGAAGSSYRLELQPIVRIHGIVRGEPIDDTFAPSLPFTLTAAVLSPDAAPAPTLPGATYTQPSPADLIAQALKPSKDGTVPVAAPNLVSVARYHLAVSLVRGLGLGLLGLAALFLLVRPFRRERVVWTNEERVAFRHGCTVVDLAALPTSGSCAAAASFDALAALAEFSQRPILRVRRDGGDVFAVEEGGRLFQYTASPRPRAVSSPIDPAPTGTAPERAPRSRRRFWPIGLLLGVLVATAIATTLTAATSVPISYADVQTQTLGYDDLTPSQCAAVAVTKLLVATSSSTTGTSGADLMLGRNATGTQSLSGSGGNDCLIGGGSSSSTTNNLNGGSGTDVCISPKAAKETFTSCETTYSL